MSTETTHHEIRTRLEDPEVISALQHSWIGEIDFYLKYKRSVHPILVEPVAIEVYASEGYTFSVSDRNNPAFNYQPCPDIDGYQWYRGYAITNVKTGAELFILKGWMIFDAGEAPDPVCYTRGEIELAEARRLVEIYCRLNQDMQRQVAEQIQVGREEFARLFQ